MSEGIVPPARTARSARLATTAAFAVNAVAFGAWVPRIPEMKQRLGLSPAALGFGLLAMAVGSLLATTFIGRACTRWGSGRVVLVTAIGYCLLGWLPGLATDLPELWVFLLVWGTMMGALDVSMNTQGVIVERSYGRPVLSGFHASFSLGTLFGALIGSLAAGLRVPIALQQAVIELTMLIVFLPMTRWFLPDPPLEPPAATSDPATTERARWLRRVPRMNRRLVVLGFASIFALLCEGAVSDWSGVLLRDTIHVSAGQVGFGYAAFAATMTLGRIAGDRAVLRLGRTRTLVILGGIGTVGCAAGLASSTLVGVVIGFALLGVGIATMFPTYLSTTADAPGPAGPALAAVTGLGYTGFLIGPTLIGLVAQSTSVLGALWLVPVLTAGSAALGVVGVRMTRRLRAASDAQAVGDSADRLPLV